MDANESDLLPWHSSRIALHFTLGELKLFSVPFKGVRSDPDIFSTTAFETLQPPASTLASTDSKAAYIYSCPISKDLPSVSVQDRCIRYIPQHYRHFYVAIDKTFEEYLAEFTKKSLSTLKRKVRKAEASNKGDQSFSIYSRAEELDEFFELALPISRVSYQHTLLGHGLPDDSSFRESAKQLAAEGKIICYLLYADDKPVAYNTCPVYGDNVVLYDHTGYDPQYSKYSPGSVLQYKIIEHLFSEKKYTYYDLCTGEGQHKELFATGSKLCANVYFFPLRPVAALAVGGQLLLNTTTSLVKRVAERLGAKDKLKKFFRSRGR